MENLRENSTFHYKISERIFMKYFEFFGLQNFNSLKLTEKNVKIHASKLRKFFVLLRFILVYGAIYFFTFQMFKDRSKTVNSNKLIGAIIFFMQIMAVIVLFLIITRPLMKTCDLKKVYIISRRIFKFVKFDLSFLNIEVCNKSNLMIVIIIFYLSNIFLHFSNFIFYGIFKIYALGTFFPNLFVMAAFCHFIFLVEMSNNNLKTLLKVLKNIKDKNNQQYVIQTFNSNQRLVENHNMKVLKICRRIYNNCHESCKKINEIYGIILMIYVIIAVIIVTYNGYSIFAILVRGKDYTKLTSN